jgi:hypothetical protein
VLPHVAGESLGFLTGNYRDDAVLVGAYALGRAGQPRDEHEHRYEDGGSDKRDKAGKELSTREELKHGDDEVGCDE